MFSSRYGQSFHSSGGARKEAEDLYIKSSAFEAFFCQHQKATVLDVGLGLGYNAVATLNAAKTAAHMHPNLAFDLRLISLEHDLHLVDRLTHVTAPWIESWDAFDRNLLQNFHGQRQQSTKLRNLNIHWQILVGDAALLHHQLPEIGTVDFIWQDPFSPEVNPELWTPLWFSTIRQMASSSATLMTYSVSRPVKNALSEAGWSWIRIPTTTQKRAWLKANPLQ